MPTSDLLDQSRKFVVLGSDEKIWFFAYELDSTSQDRISMYYWQAYSQLPGGIVMPEGPWAEDAVLRFLNKHGHKLDSEDRVDLLFFLYLGGFERYLKKNRIKEKR